MRRGSAFGSKRGRFGFGGRGCSFVCGRRGRRDKRISKGGGSGGREGSEGIDLFGRRRCKFCGLKRRTWDFFGRRGKGVLVDLFGFIKEVAGREGGDGGIGVEGISGGFWIELFGARGRRFGMAVGFTSGLAGCDLAALVCGKLHVLGFGRDKVVNVAGCDAVGGHPGVGFDILKLSRRRLFVLKRGNRGKGVGLLEKRLGSRRRRERSEGQSGGRTARKSA